MKYPHSKVYGILKKMETNKELKRTTTENTKWLDDIYSKSFDCLKYGRTKVECKIIKIEVGNSKA